MRFVYFPRIAVFYIGMTCSIFAPAFGASDVLSPLMQKAWQSARNGDNAEHITQARMAIAHAPNDADWHEILALCLNQSTDTKHEALKEAETAYRLKPTSARIITTYAILLEQGNLGQEAGPLAAKALRLDPTSGRAHAALSSYYLNRDQQEHAQSEIDQALRLSKNDWDVNLMAAHFYKTLIDERAGPCLDRLVQAFPKNANAYAERAAYRQRANDPIGAVADMRKSLQIDPKQFTQRCHLGFCLLEMQRYKEALHEYDLAIAQEPEPNPTSYVLRSRAYQSNGDLKHAIADASTAIALSNARLKKPADVYVPEQHLMSAKNYRWCWLKRMAWYDKTGQRANALSSATQLIKADPNCDDALQLRQEILRKQGRYTEALADLSALIRIDAGVQDWYSARGEVLQKLGKTEEAATDFAKAEHLEKYGQ